jgi:peptidoglycan/xylan/chitin deacetylase (PgdA/CDA1 family)
VSAQGSERVRHAVSGVPVLMYHSIAANSALRFQRFVVHPDEFRAQMAYLDDEGYRAMTAANLVVSWSSGQPLPLRPVVLTFDDAFTDFYRTALPILREHGFRATLYVPTGYIGGTARWLTGCGEADREVMSWQALQDIAAESIEIATHSHTHPQMDRVSAAVLRDEVHRSRCLLEDSLAVSVEGFAYPFGYWNHAARAAVATEGFRYACAVADLIAAPGDNVLTLPRLTVNAGLGVTGLARLLDARSTPVERLAAAVKRVTWMALRQRLESFGGDPREGWPA